ncbi:MAG: UDP-galactopyranose mutase [archaeon]
MDKLFVIGAGLSGLSLVNELKEYFNEVIILEKDSEIGGLCKTKIFSNHFYEFGPHIIYSKNNRQREWWRSRINIRKKKYFVNLSINGEIKKKNLFDFPLTRKNLDRIGGNLEPKKSNFENFEDYMISNLGKKAYRLFVRGYNRKQWGIIPKKLNLDWSKGKPLKLYDSRKEMFDDENAGAPLSFNNLFHNLIADSKIKVKYNSKVHRLVKKNSLISKILYSSVSGKRDVLSVKKNDFVVNTAPIDRIMFFPFKLKWRGVIKLFFLIKSNDNIPSYSTTFPNNYFWTRLIDYDKQKSISLNDSLISFAFPYDANYKLREYEKKVLLKQSKNFIQNQLDSKMKDYFFEKEPFSYPLPSIKNEHKLDEIIEIISKIENFVSLGRLGTFSYISMSKAVSMSLKFSDYFKNDFSGNKKEFYDLIRNKIW